MLTKKDWEDKRELCKARQRMQTKFGTCYSPIVLAPDNQVAKLNLRLGDGYNTYYEIGSDKLDRAIDTEDRDSIPDLVYELLTGNGNRDIVVVGTAWAAFDNAIISEIERLGARYEEI